MVPVSIISLDLMLVKIGPQDGEVGIEEASSPVNLKFLLFLYVAGEQAVWLNHDVSEWLPEFTDAFSTLDQAMLLQDGRPYQAGAEAAFWQIRRIRTATCQLYIYIYIYIIILATACFSMLQQHVYLCGMLLVEDEVLFCKFAAETKFCCFESRFVLGFREFNEVFLVLGRVGRRGDG